MINSKKCLLAIILTILASGAYAQDSESRPDNEIWYTSSDGKIVSPNKMDAFGAKLLSITNKDGKGVIKFDGNVTSIGNSAFDGCGNLTSIEIPESVTSIGNSAFAWCSGLTSIEIPESVTSIGEEAFYNCSGLASIEIPSNVTSIGKEAFSRCSSLTSISVSSGNNTYDSRNNCNAIINSQTNELIVGCKNTIIPNSVTSIGENAFRDCNGLTSIEIPEGVTSIGDDAFCGTDLISIEIPESVMGVGKDAFYACYDLTSVTISEGVKSIGEAAFMVCHDLTSLALPQSITDIGENAFMGCSGLSSISVSSGNNSYDSRDNCNAIINSQTNELIVGCKNTIIPNSVTSIGNSAFNGCSGLASIEIPEGVTSIGNDAFYGCI